MPRHYRTTRTGSKPRYLWVPARDVENAVVATMVQTADLLAAVLNDAARETGPGMVIERVIGSITVASQVVGSGGDFALGIIVAPEAGFASIPAPLSEINDYLVWVSGRFPTGANEQSAGVFQADELTYQFDVRSRRRLRSVGDEVRGVVSNLNSTSMIFSIATRILLRVT